MDNRATDGARKRYSVSSMRVVLIKTNELHEKLVLGKLIGP